MPIHNWKSVPSAIFHDFHHSWITEIARHLNESLLPDRFYALIEQQPYRLGDDVRGFKARLSIESDEEFYRRKKSSIAVRRAGDDQLVAVIDVVVPGNKSSSKRFQELIDIFCGLIEFGVHLVAVDLFPPNKSDPQGIHGAIWNRIDDARKPALPIEKPLTLVTYEAGSEVKAFLEPVAVGDTLPAMPLFLEPGRYVQLPLEETYQRALMAMPKRWRDELK